MSFACSYTNIKFLERLHQSDDELERLLTLIGEYQSTLPPMLVSTPDLRTLYTPHALSASAHLRMYKDKALQGSAPDMEMCMVAVRDLFLAYTECDLCSLKCMSPVLGVSLYLLIYDQEMCSSLFRGFGRMHACSWLLLY